MTQAASVAQQLAAVWAAVSSSMTPSGFYTTVVTLDGTVVASGIASQVSQTLQAVLSSRQVSGLTGAAWLSALTTAADAPSVGGQYVNNWATYSYMQASRPAIAG